MFSASAVYLSSNTLNALIPFALLPILTRALGPTQYGEVAMFQTVLTALVAVTGLSLQGAAGRKYYDFSDDTGDLKYYIGACFQLLAASTAVVLLVVAIFRHQLATWLGIETRWLPWAVAGSAATFIVQMRMTQWQMRKQPVNYGIMQVSQSLLNMGASVFLVVVLLRGAAGRIEAIIGVPMLMAAASLWLLHRDGLLGASWRPEFIREAASYGVPLLPHVVGLLLLSSFDRIIVNSELGVAQAGVYMVAVQLAMGLALLFDSVNNSYVPWLFERLTRDAEHEKRQIVRWSYVYFAFALACAGVAFLIGPAAVRMIAGVRYAEAGKAIGWLALGQAFAGMYLVVTNYIFYSKRTGVLSLTTIASGLLTVAALPYMTRHHGLSGAAWVFAGGMFVRFVLTWWVANLRHPMPWFNPRFKTQSEILNVQ